MTKHYKVAVAASALFLSAFFSASAATTPPKVVFIGDWITYGWNSVFAANPNWINKGSSAPGEGSSGQGTSGATLARFQSDVVSLHPSIVHIMVGADDAFVVYDSGYSIYIQIFLDNLDAMVKEAKAANIKVVLGMEAQNFELAGNLEPINAVIAAYGAAHNIPVINYGDVLCGCVGSINPGGIGGGNWSGSGVNSVPPAPFLVPDSPGDSILIPSTDGYAVMTQMAENAIAAMNLTLRSGYLQNVQADNANGHPPEGLVANVNGVESDSVIQFTPQGRYSDGIVRPVLNSTFPGSNGTWSSSNPLVMYVDQKGLAWALTQGTATISYTSPTGVRFSPWVMTVGNSIP